MKHTKKFVTMIIVLAMILTMAISASAATIDVKTVLNGETYTAYKILNYTAADTDDDGTNDIYSYYLTKDQYESGLGAALEAAGFAFQKSADGTQYFVTNAEEVDVAAAAESLSGADLSAAIDEESVIAADGKASFTGLDTGYYFVTSSLGSLCALHDENAIANVVEKNTMITDAKEVDAENASMQIGDTATYTITLTDGTGTNKEAVLTDTMSAGLTYNNDATVTAKGTTLNKDVDYTVAVSEGSAGATVITYTFTAAVIADLDENDEIVVTYTATLNANASATETNTEKVAYSAQETAGNTVTVASYNLTIQKKAESETGDSLKGAKFEMYRDAATDATQLVAITVADPAENTVYYRVAAAGEQNATTTIDMTNAYDAVIYGLDGDSTYTLREIKAPDGYNLLEDDVEVVMEDANKVQPIVNNAGSVLPSTGGIGTTVFYILGGLLAVGALVILITNKRMRAN